MSDSSYENLTKKIAEENPMKFNLWKDEDYEKLKFGDFLITGVSGPKFERIIGYVTQVRVRAGAFGSDMILLRHKCGTLTRHENQTFTVITDEEHLKQLREHWEYSAEWELQGAKDGGFPPHYYTLGNSEFPETGFIVPEKPKDEDTGAANISFAMAVVEQ